MIHDPGQRVFVIAAEAEFEFEVAPGRGIHDQRLVARFDAQAPNVGYRAALGIGNVLQQAPGRAQRRTEDVAAKSTEIAGAELPAQQIGRGFLVVMPGRSPPGTRLVAGDSR